MKRTRLDAERWFEVILESDDAQAAAMTLASGRATGGPANAHRDSDQWLFVVSGRGTATVEDRTVDLEAGDLLLIEAGETHEIRNDGSEPLETLNLYVPPEY